MVAGHSFDVLAWNPLGHALLAGHLDPNSPERPGERHRVKPCTVATYELRHPIVGTLTVT